MFLIHLRGVTKMGKGAQRTRGDEMEVLIEGELYDVSGFRHPGGSVVKFLTGNGDACSPVPPKTFFAGLLVGRLGPFVDVESHETRHIPSRCCFFLGLTP